MFLRSEGLRLLRGLLVASGLRDFSLFACPSAELLRSTPLFAFNHHSIPTLAPIRIKPFSSRSTSTSLSPNLCRPQELARAMIVRIIVFPRLSLSLLLPFPTLLQRVPQQTNLPKTYLLSASVEISTPGQTHSPSSQVAVRRTVKMGFGSRPSRRTKTSSAGEGRVGVAVELARALGERR